MELKFDLIRREKIFNDDFVNMSCNNVISFDNSKISILYAPNGVGKSSLCRVLSGDGEFKLNYNNSTYTQDDCDLFHIISDQNGRNVIDGEVSDFLLGDNIYEEFKLRESLESRFNSIFFSVKDQFKNNFNLSKASDKKFVWLNYDYSVIKKIVKNNSKVSDIEIDEYINFVKSLSPIKISQFEQDKFDFIKDDSNFEIIKMLLDLPSLSVNQEVERIEEYDDAICILKKYSKRTDCIVCDNSVDPKKQLSKKELNKENLMTALDDKTKEILEKISNIPNDPFFIRGTVVFAITDNDYTKIVSLRKEIEDYLIVFNDMTINLLVSSLDKTFIKDYEKYLIMKNNPLSFSDEDICFIEEFVAKNIGKKIMLERKDNKIAITLDSENLLGVDRGALKLSTGEQNFISLTFELLKAKNLDNEIVVIDDPISSFDSIFKNKLVYAIVKFLENKKVLLLTHNLDLLRLINYQSNSVYNLYLLNNFDNQVNGFIKIEKNEIELLLSTPKLLEFFRSDVLNYVKDEKMFAYSMIPFLRGYVDLTNEIGIKRELNRLMHGYLSDIVDLHNVFLNLLNLDLSSVSQVSVPDILGIDIDSVGEILDKDSYPLLNSTLCNNLTYLYLRLKTEKVLTEKFSAKGEMLSQIINTAFKSNSSENIKNRIFFFSKKTLLNEFNHFDGSLNIFQPAIDISEDLLNREKKDILEKLDSFII